MYQMRSVVKKPVAGDLVFFKNTYKVGISHVGIFLGDNKFISATSSKGVAVVSLENTYWNSKYAGTFSVI
jgi:cell wall-associated NlpC family hydrolase